MEIRIEGITVELHPEELADPEILRRMDQLQRQVQKLAWALRQPEPDQETPDDV